VSLCSCPQGRPGTCQPPPANLCPSCQKPLSKAPFKSPPCKSRRGSRHSPVRRGEPAPTSPARRSRALARDLPGDPVRASRRPATERFGVAPSTLHREVDRLAAAGLIDDRSVGRTRLLTAATGHRAATPLTQLLAVTFGPLTVVADEFAEVRNVESVHIYDSWAARYEGVPGPPPSDVDVLVIGRPSRTDVYAASDRAQDRLGIPVNPSIRTRAQWLDPSDALVRQIKESPYVDVLDSDDPTGSRD